MRFSVNDVLADVAEDRRTANRSMESYGRFTLTLDPAHRAVYTVSGEMFREEWQQTFCLLTAMPVLNNIQLVKNKKHNI